MIGAKFNLKKFTKVPPNLETPMGFFIQGSKKDLMKKDKPWLKLLNLEVSKLLIFSKKLKLLGSLKSKKILASLTQNGCKKININPNTRLIKTSIPIGLLRGFLQWIKNEENQFEWFILLFFLLTLEFFTKNDDFPSILMTNKKNQMVFQG